MWPLFRDKGPWSAAAAALPNPCTGMNLILPHRAVMSRHKHDRCMHHAIVLPSRCVSEPQPAAASRSSLATEEEEEEEEIYLRLERRGGNWEKPEKGGGIVSMRKQFQYMMCVCVCVCARARARVEPLAP